MDAASQLGRLSISQGSESFASAARLFPAGIRDSASMLYAACRYCDDVIDGQSLGCADVALVDGSPQERLERLTEGMRSAMKGSPPEQTVYRAFHRVVNRHQIPETYVMDLLAGFRMDVERHTYHSLTDTLGYAYHVAGVVGVMMTFVMGVRDRDALDRACDLGIALQLTNIARDVLEDAGMDRCYLPRNWLAEAAIPVDRLTDPAHRQALARVTRRLLRSAEPYYASATTGLSWLRFRNAWAVAAAQSAYREIGTEVCRRGASAWDQRVRVSRGRKLVLALGAGVRAAYAVSLGRLNRPVPRAGLWTRPRYEA